MKRLRGGSHIYRITNVTKLAVGSIYYCWQNEATETHSQPRCDVQGLCGLSLIGRALFRPQRLSTHRSKHSCAATHRLYAWAE